MTTDILLEDKLQPSFDLVTVVQEREVHKPKCRTKLKSFIVFIIAYNYPSIAYNYPSMNL